MVDVATEPTIPLSLNFTGKPISDLTTIDKQFNDYIKRWDEVYRYLGADLSNIFVSYVRRDGTLPLTGDWDVGGFDITGIKDLKAATAQIGTDTNNSTFEADGTLEFNGNATVWEDIQSSLIGRRLASTSGGVSYNYTNNSVTFEPNGDETDINKSVQFNIQLAHATKKDSDLRLHVHFEQPADNNYEFTAGYRIQDNGQLKTTAWTTISADVTNDSVFTYVSGTLIQIVSFGDIDLTGVDLSALVQIQFARTDSISGDIEVIFVDAHYEIDTVGSRTELSK